MKKHLVNTSSKGRISPAKKSPGMKISTSSRVRKPSVYIEKYSDRSFVVRGETKDIKDDMKALGGKYNRNLEGGVGWIFSLKALDKVEAYLKKGIIPEHVRTPPVKKSSLKKDVFVPNGKKFSELGGVVGEVYDSFERTLVRDLVKVYVTYSAMGFSAEDLCTYIMCIDKEHKKRKGKVIVPKSILGYEKDTLNDLDELEDSIYSEKEDEEEIEVEISDEEGEVEISDEED